MGLTLSPPPMPAALRIQTTSQDVKAPQFTNGGYTLFSAEDKLIPANKVVSVPVGARLAFPKEFCGLIVDGGNFFALGGLVDSDFRGEVTAMIYSPCEVQLKKGAPVARLMVIEIALPEIETEDYLRESDDAENVMGEGD